MIIEKGILNGVERWIISGAEVWVESTERDVHLHVRDYDNKRIVETRVRLGSDDVEKLVKALLASQENRDGWGRKLGA